MIYVSLDLETTGLNPEVNSILEMGAVCDNLAELKPLNELKTFQVYFDLRSATFDFQAAIMNTDILKKIDAVRQGREPGALIKPDDFVVRFKAWLEDCGIDTRFGFTPAGKNFAGFDLQYLRRLPGWREQIRIKQRSIDPASHFWRPGDLQLPTLQQCIDRAGICTAVAHTSVSDAMDVVRLVRKALCGWEESK